ncbi:MULTISPECIES: hypothetical protein [unclassified Acinetobacter]|uniref:hypothetical protein n=1 Tax=unclassified Acinetobacter TaxID=196816 RepID=UPI002934E60F|nr:MULTISPECIES: hypothetical protein [unclassified Acinetobacter]WOE32478.1 hypothetical protein QSG84_04530 [Acinetobacter sp. SAAs470]WOE37954.1 hypothetical protein QSG86_13580 [Acinetobacter sp. SAAs474]
MLIRLILSASLLSILSGNAFSDDSLDHKDFNVNGAVRFSYVYNDYLDNHGNKVDFADAVLWLNYKKENISGHLDYRFYQANDKLGELHFPVNAWLSYDLNPENNFKIGLQPVPLGLGRYYSSTYNLTILYQLGLEEVNNWGLTYKYSPQNFNLTAGYFIRDAGSHVGNSHNSAHYSSNLTAEPEFKQGTQLKEKNLLSLKLDKDFSYHIYSNDISSNIGVSYLHSQVNNLRTDYKGRRDVWTLFQKSKINDIGFNFMYGGQNIKNKDDIYPDESTFGFFDGYYNVANKSNFLTTELNYTLPVNFKNFSSPYVYINYSRFIKNKAGSGDSQRLITGVYTKYKENLQFYLEYINSKNDNAFGSEDGYAQGNDHHSNNTLYLSLGYYF